MPRSGPRAVRKYSDEFKLTAGSSGRSTGTCRRRRASTPVCVMPNRSSSSSLKRIEIAESVTGLIGLMEAARRQDVTGQMEVRSA